MEKTIFEQMGGTYEQQGNYLIPVNYTIKCNTLGK